MASSPRIEELRKKFEENPRRYFAPLANEYRKAGEIDQAVAICREYLPQQPGHMSGHIVYGQALYEARQFEEAKSVFETALTLDPENLIALRHLGDIALIIGDTDGARGWYRRVLDADPRNEEIQAQIARIDAGAAPTPAVGVAVPASEPAPPTASVTAEAPSIGTAGESTARPRAEQPAASSAPTVVQAAIRPAAMVVTANSPTAEIRLDDAATESAPSAAASPTSNDALIPAGADVPDRLTLDSVIPGTTAGDAPAVSSFSLDGLETTSLTPDQPSPAPSSPALDLDMPPSDALPTASAGAPPELPELRLSTSFAAPASEAVPELLDLSSPAPSRPSAPAVPAVPAVPAETVAARSSPALEDLIIPPEPAADAAPPESGPFVTETMAELYLRQGHREEALTVYRALLEQRPGDAALQAKIDSLQGAPAPVAAEPTIREVLLLVATRRPGFRPEGKRQNGSAPPPPPVEAASAVLPEDAHDAIGALFGGSAVSDVDEMAARTLALAFASDDQMATASASGLFGAPARVASDELSLAAVFSGDTAAPSTFSFDQFFSKRAAAQQDGAAAATGGAESPEDVAQFTSWLQGLKHR